MECIFLDMVPWLCLFGYTIYVGIKARIKFMNNKLFYKRLKKQTNNCQYFFILFPLFVLLSRIFILIKRIIYLASEGSDIDGIGWMDSLGYSLSLL
jgi:hypothetical protein